MSQIMTEGRPARSDYHVAAALGRRVYYCNDSQTVRSCPESFCIAARRGDGTWALLLDQALEVRLTPGQVGRLRALVAVKWRHHPASPITIVDEVAAVIS